MGLYMKHPIALKKDLIQLISLMTVAMALYSASADEWDMVPCFFIFQAIRERPIIIRKPVKDHLVKGQAPQCEAQKA